MTDFSIEKAATLSLVLHIVMFVFITLAQRAGMKTPETVYTIDLVTPTQVREEPAEPVQKQAPAPTAKTSEPSTTVAPLRVDKSAMKHKEDAIRALKQRQEQQEAESHLKDRMKELGRTTELGSIREAAARKAAEASAKARSATGPEAEALLARYMQGIESAIKKNWVFQDPGQATSLRTDVLIAISAEGAVEVKKIAKPSGNRAFDQSTLKAIAKTPSVEPPPFGQDIEILISFWPEN